MKTIRGKIMVTVLVVSLLSLGVLSAVVLTNILGLKADITEMSDELGHTASQESQEAITAELLDQLTNLAESKADLISERLEKLQTYVNMSADYIENLYANPDDYADFTVNSPDASLAGQVSSQLLYSAAAWVDRESVADELGLVGNVAPFLETILTHDSDVDATYYSTVSGINIQVDALSDYKEETVEAAEGEWFVDAAAQGELIWTDIYEDDLDRGLYIACSAPVYDDDTLMGVVGYSMAANTIGENVIDTAVGESGYIFVINETGRIIISAHLTVDVTGTIIRESLVRGTDERLVEVNDKVLAGESGIAQVTYQGQEVLMAYQPIDTLPWAVIAIMDLDEALEPAVAIADSIDTSTDTTVIQLNQVTNDVVLAIILVALSSILIITLVSMVLAKRITRPLGHLIRGVEQISAGRLDTYIMVATKDEIFHLSTAFNSMAENLQSQIDEVTAVTAEKERIGAELEVATQIQASMLPCIFPAFPEHKEFDVFASMEPAKEVGGDFYDFFLVDENHLGMVMADVSGKGVPAALFMVIAKTLIKNHAQNGESPSQVLTNVNDQLCENNDAGMFVTCWMGILDIHSGVLTYGNAGHNPPLLCRKNGQFEYIKMTPGFVLAGMEGIRYRQAEITLDKGDIIYLYTDGVTEATDIHNELYGEDRLEKVLNANRIAPLDDMLHAIKADIDLFVGEAPQFDDITMLGLSFGEKDSQ